MTSSPILRRKTDLQEVVWEGQLKASPCNVCPPELGREHQLQISVDFQPDPHNFLTTGTAVSLQHLVQIKGGGPGMATLLGLNQGGLTLLC